MNRACPPPLLVARQERGVVLDVPEQRERHEVRRRVAPEHALAVDQSADARSTVALHEDVALPQVEVDQVGDGDLVEGVVGGLRRARHLVRGQRQPGPARRASVSTPSYMAVKAVRQSEVRGPKVAEG